MKEIKKKIGWVDIFRESHLRNLTRTNNLSELYSLWSPTLTYFFILKFKLFYFIFLVKNKLKINKSLL